MLSPEATRRRLAHQNRIFLGLVDVAVDAGTAGRYDDAAAFAQLAARYASDNHPAAFASPALETLLARVGAATMPPWQWEQRPSPCRVLHVLTKAIGVGGHTRYALRWLENDTGRVHSLALTGQQGAIPDQLAAAVAASGGETRALGGGLMERAAELRALAGDADVVVLYAHPFDVVPVIAFAGQAHRPPVLFVNHSDHCFWIGQATADLVACIRDQGARICTERRGIAADRCVLLPVPLAGPKRLRTKEQAKEELGLPSSAVVLLTVAASYKYEPIDGVDFLDLAAPVVDACPEAVLLAVGPHGRRWHAAERRTGGRIRALGAQPDVQRYYEACDVYLDAHPVSSVTSLLEAASLGAPAMTLCPEGDGTAVLCSEDPGLDGMETRAATPEAYRSMLRRLVADPQLRGRLGSATADQIASTHAVDRWRTEVEAIYDRLGQVGPVDPDIGPAPTAPGQPGPVDEVLCRIQTHPVLHPGLFPTVYRERGRLPRPLRNRQWVNLAMDEAAGRIAGRAGPWKDGREERFVRAAARLRP